MPSLDVAAGAARAHPVRVGHLDGIRALAILSVVSFHWNRGLVPGAFRGGYIGVDVFLTLSGYLITSILLRRRHQSDADGFVRFMRARFMRLYPALVGLVVGVLLITTVAPGGFARGLRPSPASVSVTLLQVSWIPVVQGWDRHALALIHCWSLAVEWTFYSVWPLVLWKLLKDRRDAWKYVAAGSLLVWVLSAALLPWQWFYASPLARSAQLGAGCALALFLDARGASRALAGVGVRAATLLFLLSSGFLVLWTVLGPDAGATYRWAVFGLVPLATIGLIISGFRSPRVSDLMSVSALRAIGVSSYSIYLWHVPMMLLLNHEALRVAQGGAAIALLGCTVVLSALSYWVLERPYFRGVPSPSRVAVDRRR